ncbi:MAG: hypothetical protein H6Q67_463 [Firmicutes bacterium]|nr:hypothetical protein [Bacillota bacterium]
MNRNIAVVGTGKLGKALVTALKGTGMDVIGASDKNFSACHQFAQRAKIKAFNNVKELICMADVIFLTVPDDKIEPLATQISSYNISFKNKIFFHCSGSNGLELFNNLVTYANVGCFHPLQSFVQADTSFKDIYITIDGNELVCNSAREIIHKLQAKVLFVPSDQKALYHAAACLVCNYLVTLDALADEIFSRWSIPGRALLPLIQGTVDNLAKSDSPIDALTGPISRGDSTTIAKHLQILPAKYLNSYIQLGLQTCELAVKSQKLSLEQHEHITKLLQGALREGIQTNERTECYHKHNYG